MLCVLSLLMKCESNVSHLVLLVIRDHAEEHNGVSSRCALWYEHVVRPAAAAEVELGGLCGAGVALPVGLVAERALVRDGHGRVQGSAADCVVTRSHCDAGMSKLYLEANINNQ